MMGVLWCNETKYRAKGNKYKATVGPGEIRKLCWCTQTRETRTLVDITCITRVTYLYETL